MASYLAVDEATASTLTRLLLLRWRWPASGEERQRVTSWGRSAILEVIVAAAAASAASRSRGEGGEREREIEMRVVARKRDGVRRLARSPPQVLVFLPRGAGMLLASPLRYEPRVHARCWAGRHPALIYPPLLRIFLPHY